MTDYNRLSNEKSQGDFAFSENNTNESADADTTNERVSDKTEADSAVKPDTANGLEADSAVKPDTANGLEADAHDGEKPDAPVKPMDRKAALTELFNRGAILIPYQVIRPPKVEKKQSKFPFGDWKETIEIDGEKRKVPKRYSLDQILSAPNVGLVPGSLGLVVCDIDSKNDKSAKALKERIIAVKKWNDYKKSCTILTAGGGAHMFYRAKDDSRKGKVNISNFFQDHKDKKLEVFFGDSNFVELHDVVKLVERLNKLTTFTGDIEEALKRKDTAKPQTDTTPTNHDVFSIETIKAALATIPVKEYRSNHDAWRSLAWSVKRGCDDREAAYDAFLEWSFGDSTYSAEETEKRLKSIWHSDDERKDGQRKVTVATLIKTANNHGFVWPKKEKLEKPPIKVLVKMFAKANCEIFRNDATGYARYRENGVWMVARIDSRRFKRWLRRAYERDKDDVLETSAIKTVCESLDAESDLAPQVPVWLRFGESADKTKRHIDLGRDDGKVVEIEAAIDGKPIWRILDDSPVRFVREISTGELPIPNEGGSFDSLRKFANFKNEDDFRIAIMWILGASCPTSPTNPFSFPLLEFAGEEGSGKSTIAQTLVNLIDPQPDPIQSFPKDEERLGTMAEGARVLCFDNVSTIPANMSDSLCKLSTGGAFTKRKLWTDNEAFIVRLSRPSIFTGIDELVRRPDLATRTLVVKLDAIPKIAIMDDQEIRAGIAKVHGDILGALCSAISAGLAKAADGVDISGYTGRLVGFAKWAAACEAGCGFKSGSAIEIINRNQKDARESMMEGDAFSCAIHRMMARHHEGKWAGTASDLLRECSELADFPSGRNWPQSPESVGKTWLPRRKASLREAGIVFERKRKNGKRLFVFSTTEAFKIDFDEDFDRGKDNEGEEGDF